MPVKKSSHKNAPTASRFRTIDPNQTASKAVRKSQIEFVPTNYNPDLYDPNM